MSLYVKLSMQEIADGLTAIGWSGAGGGGDASLSYGSTAPLAPTNGTLWYDTTEEILKLFRVDTWVNINVTQSAINNINAQVTLAQSYAQDAQEALAGFTSIVATATTLAPESRATATFNASTGVLTLGIPQGIQGVQRVQGAWRKADQGKGRQGTRRKSRRHLRPRAPDRGAEGASRTARKGRRRSPALHRKRRTSRPGRGCAQE